MAFGYISSWQIEGRKVEALTDFSFLGSKITADGDYSHEIDRHLFLRTKAMTNLISVLKSRDITLPAKVCILKAMLFPVVMYTWESWTIKKAEHPKLMLSNCDAGEDSWESLGQQGDKTNLKGNQPWLFTGRTCAETEAPILWPP